MSMETSSLLQELAGHLLAVDELLANPGVAALAGPGLCRELGYAVSGFRQRFPAVTEPAPAQPSQPSPGAPAPCSN